MNSIPFNKPFLTGYEFKNMEKAVAQGQLSGDGIFTSSATRHLNKIYQGSHSLITNSCTAALEMSALLLDIQQGDEIICPSYTFVSTANAFALRGAKIIFVDIDPITLCLDVKEAEKAITSRTKAIVAVHYAGVSCDLDELKKICDDRSISLVEDAAQAYNSFYKEKRLGQIGVLGTISFHETKNVIAGEGGCIIINSNKLVNQAEIIREKGTDRSLFMKGEVDKYTWRRMGSSYLPGDMVAAFLLAQLENAEAITSARLKIWQRYYNNLKENQKSDSYSLQQIPNYATHNAHMFYLLCKDNKDRDTLIDYLKQRGVKAVFHYIPLHSSPAGLKLGSYQGKMRITNKIAGSILRLPLYPELKYHEIDYISNLILSFFNY